MNHGPPSFIGTDHSFASDVKLLHQCGDSKALSAGKQVHWKLLRAGLDRDTYIGNVVLRLYTKCESLQDARAAFERIQNPDAVSWNTIIAAHIKCGELRQARNIFQSNPVRNVITWNSMIAAYATNGDMANAVQLFHCAPCRDIASWNTILTGYAASSRIREAEKIFDEMPLKNVVSWNAMIAAYAENGWLRQALQTFRMMDVMPNDVTLVTVLDACIKCATFSISRALSEGRHVYSRAVSTGLASEIKVGNALVSMFAKCGSLHDAKGVFDLMPRRNTRTFTIMIHAFGSYGCLQEAQELFDKMSEKSLISWNVLISAYTRAGNPQQALNTFEAMDIKPDAITLISVVEACGVLRDPIKCRGIHKRVSHLGLEADPRLGTALVDMYGKCGLVSEAERVFDEMPLKNIVSWSCMIAVYSWNGFSREAFKAFQLMDLNGVIPNEVTFSSVADACGQLAGFQRARVVASEALVLGIASDVFVGSSLVTMHGRCGDVPSCWSAFKRIQHKNLVSWTSIAAALAENGMGIEALRVFREMELEGFEPDKVCFMAVLSACKHSGQLQTGLEFFRCMRVDLEMEADAGHFVCLIDLLSRAGKLHLAEEIIRCMPFEPDSWTWTSLMGACRIHQDDRRGARAAEQALEIDPRRSAPYIMLKIS